MARKGVQFLPKLRLGTRLRENRYRNDVLKLIRKKLRVLAMANSHTLTETNRSAVPPEVCGMAQAADLIGDRWTMLILREALFGVTRFDAIREDLGCPRTVLSGRLKRLCEAEVLMKRPYKEPGRRTREQYVLTRKGMDLALPMIALMQWGEKHCLEGEGAAEILERRTGSLCRVSLVNESGTPVKIGETALQLKDEGRAAA